MEASRIATVCAYHAKVSEEPELNSCGDENGDPDGGREEEEKEKVNVKQRSHFVHEHRDHDRLFLNEDRSEGIFLSASRS
jgi:hypothetical protein